ncbi:hypothetical protein [Flavobacterium pectinovorum]|uniref:Uncharacterized protein n=1 Tax=Flavobacterium pectinovorum TaxID=29533 RepID=A0AB36P0L6_9FLAO|nr:hypothetical protein [Flavobacterium pectinovorum]OXB04643.1 hypothetical protein B0A72_11730 [Flavobacterium pectinovorum]SHL25180.1 hypothetical protein SAMN05444387_0139 [Flavobacterium pectinovorum]
MSTNTLSEEAEKRLIHFFNDTIDPEEMSKAIRKLNYVITLGILRQDPTLQNELINLENSFFWLNELAEVLNPYLNLE